MRRWESDDTTQVAGQDSSPAADVHIGLFVPAKSGAWRNRADLEVCAVPPGPALRGHKKADVDVGRRTGVLPRNLRSIVTFPPSHRPTVSAAKTPRAPGPHRLFCPRGCTRQPMRNGLAGCPEPAAWLSRAP